MSENTHTSRQKSPEHRGHNQCENWTIKPELFLPWIFVHSFFFTGQNTFSYINVFFSLQLSKIWFFYDILLLYKSYDWYELGLKTDMASVHWLASHKKKWCTSVCDDAVQTGKNHKKSISKEPTKTTAVRSIYGFVWIVDLEENYWWINSKPTCSTWKNELTNVCRTSTGFIDDLVYYFAH